jgi:hypothetical protein
VLELRWPVCAHAHEWAAPKDIASTLTTTTAQDRFEWIHRAHALDKPGPSHQLQVLAALRQPDLRCDKCSSIC